METVIEDVKDEVATKRKLKDIEIFTEKELFAKVALDTPYRPDHYSILLFKEGEMKLLHNLIEYNVTANHLVLLPPKSFYQIQSLSPGSKLNLLLFGENMFLEAGIHLNVGIIIDLLKADIRKSFVLEWRC
jgi:hypothetical protein